MGTARRAAAAAAADAAAAGDDGGSSSADSPPALGPAPASSRSPAGRKKASRLGTLSRGLGGGATTDAGHPLPPAAAAAIALHAPPPV